MHGQLDPAMVHKDGSSPIRILEKAETVLAVSLTVDETPGEPAIVAPSVILGLRAPAETVWSTRLQRIITVVDEWTNTAAMGATDEMLEIRELAEAELASMWSIGVKLNDDIANLIGADIMRMATAAQEQAAFLMVLAMKGVDIQTGQQWLMDVERLRGFYNERLAVGRAKDTLEALEGQPDAGNA